MTVHSILIIDDDEAVLKSFKRVFRNEDYALSFFGDPQEALIQSTMRPFDLVLCDQRMPEMLGTEFFAQFCQLYPESRRILISGYSDFNDVTDAFNEGTIHKFVLKPWTNSKLRELVAEQLEMLDESGEGKPEKSAKREKSRREKHTLPGNPGSFHGILTQDASVQAQLKLIRKTASSDAPFFIHGETGTGKELIAKAIHLESERADGPFVALNCANLTETLLESQLFGHRKGAFTGADRDQTGLLATAEGGSLFLDEVTEIPFALQAKLLRVLQEREFTPIGETTPIKFDVKVISASSLSLEQAVSKGIFREDLRYRLEVMPINLPPLRARGEDIRLLFDAFTANQLEKHGHSALDISPEVYSAIENYDWPGNIRELVNVCTYIAALAGDDDKVIGMDLLPPVIQRTPMSRIDLARSNEPVVDDTLRTAALPSRLISKEELQTAIDNFKGHRDSIARNFGISRMTLWRKMKEFELS